jgi:hypothetical protein
MRVDRLARGDAFLEFTVTNHKGTSDQDVAKSFGLLRRGFVRGFVDDLRWVEG